MTMNDTITQQITPNLRTCLLQGMQTSNNGHNVTLATTRRPMFPNTPTVPRSPSGFVTPQFKHLNMG